MKHVCAVFLPIALLLGACVQYPEEPSAGLDRSEPLIEQVDYATVRVTDNGAVSRSSQDLSRLGFGTVSQGTYTETATTEPAWTRKGPSWFLTYDVAVPIPDDQLHTTLRIRSYLTGGGWMDRDVVMLTNQYPYKATAILCTQSIFGPASEHFQDIAFAGNALFAVNMGFTRLWSLQPGSNASTELAVFGAGDHLTGDGDLLFVDVAHARVDRWDGPTATQQKTLWSFNDPLPYVDIAGLAADQGLLYVFLRTGGGISTSMLTMDYDGTVIDSVDFPLDSDDWYAEVADGILYMVDNYATPNRIDRYDIATKTRLTPVMSPAADIEGIEFQGDYMYYVDWTRGYVGRVMKADLTAAPGAAEAVQRAASPDRVGTKDAGERREPL